MSQARTGLGVVVTAGGFGVRLGGPKQFRELLGIPMVQRTIAALDACPPVEALVVVVNGEDVEYCRAEIVAELFAKVKAVVAGGEERALSVRSGLRALEEAGRFAFLAVHDGARPLVTCAEIERCLARLSADPSLEGVVAALPSTDTLKMVDQEGVVCGTPDRSALWRAQTPQLFRAEALLAAYDQPEEVLRRATDDAGLVEGRGGRVAVVEGSAENLKITTPVDLLVAEQILARRRR